MGKRTTLATAVLFAMATTGTCMASQLPSDSGMLNIPQPSTSEYKATSNSINEGEIVLVAKKAKKKKAEKKKKRKKDKVKKKA